MLGRRRAKTEGKRVPECEGRDCRYDETVLMKFEDIPTL